MRVRDVMTKDVVTLVESEKLLVADDVMRLGRIRHLPIVDASGKLVGIVTQRDLFHSGLLRVLGSGASERSAREVIVVGEAMHPDVVTTTPDAPLAEAARVMLDHKVGCLVVLEHERIVGILTETDFVKLAAGR